MNIKAEYPGASKIIAEFSAKTHLSDMEKRLLEFYSKNAGDRVSDMLAASLIGTDPIHVCQMRSKLRVIGAISIRENTLVLNYSFMNRAEEVRENDATRAKKKAQAAEALRKLMEPCYVVDIEENKVILRHEK